MIVNIKNNRVRDNVSKLSSKPFITKHYCTKRTYKKPGQRTIVSNIDFCFGGVQNRGRIYLLRILNGINGVKSMGS